MNSNRTSSLLIVGLICGFGSFAATYLWHSNAAAQTVTTQTTRESPGACPDGLMRWLGLDDAQAERIRPLATLYQDDRRPLEEYVRQQREALAKLMEGPAPSDDELLAQAERVIAAQNALERRTAQFLISLRPHLTDAQQKRLFDHFAAGVRNPGGYRWRHGQQGGGGPVASQPRSGEHEPGPRRGKGPPPGRGPGRSR